MEELREDFRRPHMGTYSLSWRGHDGLAYSAEGRGVDVSTGGIGLECAREVKPGTVIYVQARDGSMEGETVVVHCSRRGLRYLIGLELREAVNTPPPPRNARKSNEADGGEADYYDVLQISPKADMETVHRVFRIMAVRFHPDNPESGDLEEFLRLKGAYAVLSDPVRRAEYDSMRENQNQGTMPIFELKDFVTGVEAESNRRLGVLSLLYNQRRTDSDHPGVSLLDMEKLMGFPREYLNFTLWYLRAKDFVQAADNSDYALTAAGADYVEKNAPRNEILTKLIKMGPVRPIQVPKATPMRQESAPRAVKFLQEPSTANRT